MVSLFLVENDRAMRENICRSIQWAEHGIEIVGIAVDSETALSQILERRPDILLTDIEMPFMNGLDLARIVKRELPDIRTVILSGYEDVDYARRAIALGAQEYLLKPVTMADILRAVSKVGAQLEIERSAGTGEKHGDGFLAEASREMFFGSLYSGYLADSHQIFERARELGIPLSAMTYRVVRVQWGARKDIPDEELRAELYRAPDALASGFNGESVAYLLRAEDEVLLERKTEALEKWLDGQLGGYGIAADVVCGKPVSRISGLAESYQFIRQRQIRACRQEEDSFRSAPFGNDVLLDFLRTGKKTSVKRFWESYRTGIEKGCASFISRGYLYMEFLFVLRRFSEEAGIELPHDLAQTYALENRIAKDATADGFMQFACSLTEQVIALRSQKQSRASGAVVDRAKEYIEQHYMDPELSLMTVAKEVMLSPNHFSSVFKEKNGVGFSRYLTQVRIDHAKHLLTTTDMRPWEISENVGYQSINYFSMIFKKMTGVPPTQYKKEHIA